MNKRLKIFSFLFASFMLVFACLVALDLKKDKQVNLDQDETRVVASSSLDFNDYYSKLQLDCKDVEMTFNEETTTFNLTATQVMTREMFEDIDNLSLNDDFEEVEVTYKTEYDPNSNLVKLIAYSNGEKSDELYGCPFTTDEGDMDVAFYADGDIIYLSELSNAGLIENCGWFSRMLRKVAKAVAVVAVVAVAVVAVAAVAYVAAPVIATVVSTTVVGASGGAAVLGSSAALAGAIATSATAVASTAAGVAAVAATVAGAAAIGAELEDRYQIVESTIDAVKKGVKILATSIAATVSEITLEKKYYFAHLTKVLNVNYSVSMNYLEAYAVLWASGLVNASSLGRFTIEMLSKIVLAGPLKQLVEWIKNNKEIKAGYFGIYTAEEEDAAKLAYAAGGFFKGEAQSENHDITDGSGYYYHFHDFTHTIHVWYGNAS